MMDAVLDWMATDPAIAQHAAFPEFKRHIRYHLFDRIGALDAWRWFKQGWEARQRQGESL